MKRLIFIAVLLGTARILATAQDYQPVTAGELKDWCYYLAGDEMKGRKNGSSEMKQAADYIAESFKKSGLRPAFPETGYFQEYTIQGRNNTVIRERNVAGFLEGSDPELKKEWIILSAHFDHIGIGKPVKGDSIFNGADDNATGTITVMALARTLASSKNRPARSILFIAYSGEEMGLQGSRWFAQHPSIHLEKVKLNLNFEMEGESATLGRNRYILTGYQFTDFSDLLDRYNRNTGWELARKYKSPDWIFMGSDNASLAIKRVDGKAVLNIPAFTLVTTDSIDIIHKVTDEPRFQDYDNMANLVVYLTGLVIHLSSDPLDLHWNQKAYDEFFKRK